MVIKCEAALHLSIETDIPTLCGPGPTSSVSTYDYHHMHISICSQNDIYVSVYMHIFIYASRFYIRVNLFIGLLFV